MRVSEKKVTKVSAKNCEDTGKHNFSSNFFAKHDSNFDQFGRPGSLKSSKTHQLPSQHTW